MENKNPFIPLLDQIVEIMNRIQNHKGGIDRIPQELKDELKRLEKEYAAIREQESVKLILEGVNKDFNTLRIETMRSAGTSEIEKKTFERAVNAGKDAVLLKAEVEKLKAQATPDQAQKKKTKEDQNRNRKMKERRKRFKPLGENKNWIPM